MQNEVTQRETRRDAGEVVKVFYERGLSVPYIMLGTSALRHKEFSYNRLEQGSRELHLISIAYSPTKQPAL